jgi:hypothetical protein
MASVLTQRASALTPITGSHGGSSPGSPAPIKGGREWGRDRAVAKHGGADRAGRHVPHRGRMRQASLDLQGEVRQCRELPRLPARTRQRSYALSGDARRQERQQEPVQTGRPDGAITASPAPGRSGGRRRPRDIWLRAARHRPSRRLCRGRRRAIRCSRPGTSGACP